MRRHLLPIEQTYVQFITRTRLGLLVAACAVAFFVAVISFGLQSFAVSYAATLFVPLTVVAVWRYKDLSAIFRGKGSWSSAIRFGLLPASLFLLALCGLIYELHLSYHAPITRYVAPVVEGFSRSQNWVVFEAPFVEEVVFRLWLQTRLQQYLGVAGAVLAGILFLAIHVTISPWRIIVTAIITWIRYRSGSLGACIIAHYTYDVGLWAFVTYVH